MGQPMTKLKLDYINEYVDRSGKLRRYFRRGAVRGPLPGAVGSVEFMAAYQDYLGKTGRRPPTKVEGSLGRLITEYYASRPFACKSCSSMRSRKDGATITR